MWPQNKHSSNEHHVPLRYMTRSPSENCYLKIFRHFLVIRSAFLPRTSFLQSASIFLKFCVQLNIVNPATSLGVQPLHGEARRRRTSIFIFRGARPRNRFPTSPFPAKRDSPKAAAHAASSSRPLSQLWGPAGPATRPRSHAAPPPLFLAQEPHLSAPRAALAPSPWGRGRQRS